MVGSAVATMVWSSAARNIVSIRLIRMVRTSLWRQRRAWRDRRRVADIDDLGRQFRQLAGDGFGQCLLVGRVTALPFELVHADVVYRMRGGRPRGIAGIDRNLGGKSKPRQRVRRMGASREGDIAIA